MKAKLLLLASLTALLAACGGAPTGGTTPTPPSQPQIPFNQSQTQRLYGTWSFSYTIIDRFTNIYKLSSVEASTATPGDYNIFGTDEYGDLIIAGYDSKDNDFSLLDTGAIIDRFYVFNLKDTTNQSASGCYYQIDVNTGNFSQCYVLSAIRTSNSASLSVFVPNLQRQTLEKNSVATASVPSGIRAQYDAARKLIDTGR